MTSGADGGTTDPGSQAGVDDRNAEFWSELCGTSLARQLGIVDQSAESLRLFDEEYFGLYPYLKAYVDRLQIRDRPVLEIGLGYGTLGQYMAEQGAVYHGIDIAQNPVETMRYRLRTMGADARERVVRGSAHEIPFPDETFDAVVSIGCLHHTGDIGRALDEVHRVLKPGGAVVVMLYNRYSLRQLRSVDARRLLALLRRGRLPSAESIRRRYDYNAAGEAAPHTDFTSRRGVRRLFGQFSQVRIRAENFDAVVVRGVGLASRDRMLRTPLPGLLGLDLYVTARR